VFSGAPIFSRGKIAKGCQDMQVQMQGLTYGPLGFVIRGEATVCPRPERRAFSPAAAYEADDREHMEWFVLAVEDALQRRNWGEVWDFVHRPKWPLPMDTLFCGAPLATHVLLACGTHGVRVPYIMYQDVGFNFWLSLLTRLGTLGADFGSVDAVRILLANDVFNGGVFTAVLRHGVPIPLDALALVRSRSKRLGLLYIAQALRWATQRVWLAVAHGASAAFVDR
jgi:hypothetical protein